MVFTRSQAKKQQEQPQEKPQQRQQMHRKCKKTLHEITSTITSTRSPIDFIDASIEWRKNKIKGENCTFEYIFL